MPAQLDRIDRPVVEAPPLRMSDFRRVKLDREVKSVFPGWLPGYATAPGVSGLRQAMRLGR